VRHGSSSPCGDPSLCFSLLSSVLAFSPLSLKQIFLFSFFLLFPSLGFSLLYTRNPPLVQKLSPLFLSFCFLFLYFCLSFFSPHPKLPPVQKLFPSFLSFQKKKTPFLSFKLPPLPLSSMVLRAVFIGQIPAVAHGEQGTPGEVSNGRGFAGHACAVF